MEAATLESMESANAARCGKVRDNRPNANCDAIGQECGGPYHPLCDREASFRLRGEMSSFAPAFEVCHVRAGFLPSLLSSRESMTHRVTMSDTAFGYVHALMESVR
jgi:hypothetical protein